MTQPAASSSKLMQRLPKVRGKVRENADIKSLTWFRVGGPADMLFSPADERDLVDFLKNTPEDIPVNIIGVGSNVLIRDGGIRGVVIRLGRAFGAIAIEDRHCVRAGAAALDIAVARAAAEAGIKGLAFYRGVPGTIGGALRMNAGAYGTETKDALISCLAIDRSGNRHELTVDDMNYGYRHCGAPEDLIFTTALFQGREGNAPDIRADMKTITEAREQTQPIGSQTGGSTFKNPDRAKSWELIAAAGCRGMVWGDAQVSKKHCNFLINRGAASAADLENLGEQVREKVKQQSGITLHWEIKIMGEP